MRTQTKEIQQHLTPEIALQILKAGNARFMKNLKINRNLLQQLNETYDGQYPFAVVLSCIDSRASSELIFDQGLGDLFSIRIAGNILNDDIIGSMEFACKVSGAKIIVVVGHTRCGAIKGACDDVQLGKLTDLLAKIKPVVEKVRDPEATDQNSKNEEFVSKVAEANVFNVIEEIKGRSEILREMLEQKQIGIVGAMYDLHTGHIDFYES
ncbi:carbonic anhydrase family protein [Candidatus Nitrotoga fabula]|uniref:Carbonic anhydrase n=1 Tax=Candidatus Nitrotoga fabula TaxID=2182327 RepID=A0A916F801_9PROT|nr:carbonic anhydrase family protein [Candidatus Nitrotoga fabula]CAE6689131.1 Carbonic anhydrase [Candidatus Nitrotoga fabula]